jgi:hypothetical protein
MDPSRTRHVARQPPSCSSLRRPRRGCPTLPCQGLGRVRHRCRHRRRQRPRHRRHGVTAAVASLAAFFTAAEVELTGDRLWFTLGCPPAAQARATHDTLRALASTTFRRVCCSARRSAVRTWSYCNHFATRMVATSRHEPPRSGADREELAAQTHCTAHGAIIEHDGLVAHNPKVAGSNPAPATM